MKQYIYILKLVLHYVGLIIYEPQITGFAIILNVTCIVVMCIVVTCIVVMIPYFNCFVLFNKPTDFE